jgi:hypothetical protein
VPLVSTKGERKKERKEERKKERGQADEMGVYLLEKHLAR